MSKKIFYVCSYGGSGSTMLCKALSRFGYTEHIHSKFPPNKLEFVGRKYGGKCYHEWFNGIPIPENLIKHFCVIYIYRNPAFAIPSRFKIRDHLWHIQSNPNIKLEHVLSSKKDLYNIREFYNNYKTPNPKRNYKIICVKYEDIFEKQQELSKVLGVGNLNLVNKSARKNGHPELEEIYSDLFMEMNNNDFITIS